MFVFVCGRLERSSEERSSQLPAPSRPHAATPTPAAGELLPSSEPTSSVPKIIQQTQDFFLALHHHSDERDAREKGGVP